MDYKSVQHIEISVAEKLKEAKKQMEDKLSQHDEEEVTIDAEDPNDTQDLDFNESVNSLEEIDEAVSVFGVTVSPIKYQLRTELDHASEKTVQKLKRKVNQCLSATTDFIYEAIVSGQGKKVKELLMDNEDKKDDECNAAKISVIWLRHTRLLRPNRQNT